MTLAEAPPRLADLLRPCAVRTSYEREAFSERYPMLAERGAASWTIPGGDTRYVPQGLDVVAARRVAILAYYAERGDAPSVLVALSLTNGAVLTAKALLEPDGRPHRGHVGGVAVTGTSVLVASSRTGRTLGHVLRFALDDVLDRQGTNVRANASFVLDARCSFLFVRDGWLWAGDFWRASAPASYPTAPHHVHGSARGWLAGYPLDPISEAPIARKGFVGGEAVPMPSRVIFLPENVQGVAVVGRTLHLSRSWSSGDSLLEAHRLPVRGVDISVSAGAMAEAFEVSESTLALRMSAPAGTQDLAFDGEHLFVHSESGARRYATRWRAQGAIVEDRLLAIRGGAAAAGRYLP